MSLESPKIEDGSSLTPEEEKKRKKFELKVAAYRLETGDANGIPPDGYELSPDMRDAMKTLLESKNTLLSAYKDEATHKRNVEKLRKEVKKLEKGGDTAGLAKKGNDLQWEENKLTVAAAGIAKLEEEYTKSKDLTKRQVLDEFIKKKGDYIQENKDSFIAQHEGGFKERHKLAKDKKLTVAQEKKLLKEVLENEVLGDRAKIIFRTIVDWDIKFEQEKQEAIFEEREQTILKKMLHQWQEMPRWKRMAIAAAGAGTLGVAIGALAPLGFGASAIAFGGGYRAVRSLVGGGVASVFNAGAQKLTGFIFGRKKGKLEKENAELVSDSLRSEVEKSKNWLENKGKKLELARIIDQQADAYREEYGRLLNKEKNWRRGAGFAAALAGGAVGAYGLDYLTGTRVPTVSDIFESKPKTQGVSGAWQPKISGDLQTPEAPEYLKEVEVENTSVVSGGTEIYPEEEPGVLSGSHRAEVSGGATGHIETIYPEEEPGALSGSHRTEISDGAAGPAETFYPEEEPGVLSGSHRTGSVGPSMSADSGVSEPISTSGYENIGQVGKRGVWGMIENQFKTNPEYAVRFNALTTAQKTNFVANVLEANKPKFGLANIDNPPGGWKYDFSEMMKDKSQIDHYFDHARKLTEVQQNFIDQNNMAIKNWMEQNPGSRLTGPKVQEILEADWRKKGILSAIPQEKPEINLDASQPTGEFNDGMSGTSPSAGEIADQSGKGTDLQETNKGDNSGSASEIPKQEVPGEKIEQSDMTPQAVTPEQPESTIFITPFGTETEAIRAKAMSFTPEQYKVLRGITVEKLLKEIPATSEGRLEMWRNFSEGTAPDLPRPGTYWEWILRRQVKLAEYIRSFKPSPELQKLTISAFINSFEGVTIRKI